MNLIFSLHYIKYEADLEECVILFISSSLRCLRILSQYQIIKRQKGIEYMYVELNGLYHLFIIPYAFTIFQIACSHKNMTSSCQSHILLLNTSLGVSFETTFFFILLIKNDIFFLIGITIIRKTWYNIFTITLNFFKE